MSEELLTKDMIEVDVDWEQSGSQVRWRYKEQYRDEDDEEWRGTPFQRYEFRYEREMIEQVADWLDENAPW